MTHVTEFAILHKFLSKEEIFKMIKPGKDLATLADLLLEMYRLEFMTFSYDNYDHLSDKIHHYIIGNYLTFLRNFNNWCGEAFE